jgi:hypothetical protein
MIHQSNLHSKSVINREQIVHDWPSASSTKFFQEIVVDEQRSLDLKILELGVITSIKVTGCFFVDPLADFPLSNGTLFHENCTPRVKTPGPGGYDKSSEEAQEVVVKKEERRPISIMNPFTTIHPHVIVVAHTQPHQLNPQLQQCHRGSSLN